MNISIRDVERGIDLELTKAQKRWMYREAKRIGVSKEEVHEIEEIMRNYDPNAEDTTPVSCRLLRDRRLSYSAIFTIVSILCIADNWDGTLESFAEYCSRPIEEVYEDLTELFKYGYAACKGGGYDFFEIPLDEDNGEFKTEVRKYGNTRVYKKIFI